MKKTFVLHSNEFISSSQKTEQYKNYHRTFKREFTKFLKDLGCSKIEIGRPNHFDVSGFFTGPNGQIWYFSISDLRYNKDRMLVRTAEHYKDWTGGSNFFIPMKSENEFTHGIESLIK